MAENVSGIIKGKARGYVKQIFHGFKKIGYDCQLFFLNAATMGVPQRRERTFFIGNRLNKRINLDFDEKEITIASIFPDLSSYKMVTASNERHYAFGRIKNAWPTLNSAAPTLTATGNSVDMAKGFPGDGSFIEPRKFSDYQKSRISSFPDDFNFLKSKPGYICGMSVPPFMMQRIAHQIQEQLLGNP